MNTILFSLPGNEQLSNSIAALNSYEQGKCTIRRFPDGESYIKVESDVKNKKAVLVCTLVNPDEKFLPLYFFAKALKEQGASHVCLIVPYLAYMRQDMLFNTGETLTSVHFSGLLSGVIDSLITIDPHLHRYNSLSEIYSVPTKVVHSGMLISEWVRGNVQNPVIVGPDSESEQWVAQVAKDANCPYIVLQKKRKGDREVEVSIPQVELYTNHTPVLVDDIVSTAKTMIVTVKHLKQLKMKTPVCIGVHAIFADSSYSELQQETTSIVTCNTIPHASNRIDVAALLSKAIAE